MTTTIIPSQQQVPSSIGKTLTTELYVHRVRRARRLLQILFWLIIVTGVVTTVISFFAVTDTLERYQKMVKDSGYSANAAQQARSALLAYHSAAADFLSRKAQHHEEATKATKALQDGTKEWVNYQDAFRDFWRNKEQNQSDIPFGENEVFSAADSATWRYKADIDAMIALIEIGDADAAETFFLRSDRTLRREVVPALNGLENVKLESMEEAYATTNAAIRSWQQALMLIGGLAVLLLIIGFGLTRFWLHYAWTWELAIASLMALLLFVWFNITLIRAATQAKVLVRDTYDTLSGIQTVKGLLTQTEAVESLAIFNAQQALIRPEKAENYREQAALFLSDADAYLFLLEQRLCGEPELPNQEELSCIDETFLNQSGGIGQDTALAGEDGKKKYGLRRNPLIVNAFTNKFEWEPLELENIRQAIVYYKKANQRLKTEIESEQSISAEQREQSKNAYLTMIDGSINEQTLVYQQFYGIYSSVIQTMNINWWLAFIFSGLALLGAWGIRRRRQALFA